MVMQSCMDVLLLTLYGWMCAECEAGGQCTSCMQHKVRAPSANRPLPNQALTYPYRLSRSAFSRLIIACGRFRRYGPGDPIKWDYSSPPWVAFQVMTENVVFCWVPPFWFLF